MPPNVSFSDAVYLAGAVGKLNVVDLHLDLEQSLQLVERIFGGTFLFLGYFGCDQSQVQRFLTGKSVAQSRLSLLFNAMAKVPMQFFILFVGAMVFVFYLFAQPPCSSRLARCGNSHTSPASQKFRLISIAHSQNANTPPNPSTLRAKRTTNPRSPPQPPTIAPRKPKPTPPAAPPSSSTRRPTARSAFSDTNYIFLSFVTKYFPVGFIGLVIAVIFTAAMSSSSGELNSLAAVSVMDIYRRHFKPAASDRHYLIASRVFTAIWGAWAVIFAQYARHLGSLVEAVNQVGSFFYPVMLGAFVLAFFCNSVRGSARPSGRC